MVAAELSCHRTQWWFQNTFQKVSNSFVLKPLVSSFGFAKSVVLKKKKSHQKNCSRLCYLLDHVSMKRCGVFCHGADWNTSTLEVKSSIKAKTLSYFSIFLPWSSDLSSCWGAVALASGSVEITSCSASSWRWLLARALFSMGKGCGIEPKSWGERKHPSLLLLRPRKEQEVPISSSVNLTKTSEVARALLGCQKSLVLDTSGTWLWVLPLLLSGLSAILRLADSCCLSHPAPRKLFPAAHTLLFSWKANSLPFAAWSAAAKQQGLLLPSAIFSRIRLRGTCAVSPKNPTTTKKQHR